MFQVAKHGYASDKVHFTDILVLFQHNLETNFTNVIKHNVKHKLEADRLPLASSQHALSA